MRTKKIMGSLLVMYIFCMIFTGKAYAGNWYDKVIESTGGSYKVKTYSGAMDKSVTRKVKRSSFTKYCVRDINKDGVKELFLLSDTSGINVLMLTYHKKKITPVSYFQNCRGFFYKGDTVTYVTGSSSAQQYITYKLSSGKLKKAASYWQTTSSSFPVPSYSKNGKKCSKTAFDSVYKKYCSKSKEFSFSQIKTKIKVSLKKMQNDIPKGSWWSTDWKYSLGFSGKYAVVGNTYGKIIGKYKVKYVLKTSYGYFINISGYHNYRWYSVNPHRLECYSSAYGNGGYLRTAGFYLFGC